MKLAGREPSGCRRRTARRLGCAAGLAGLAGLALLGCRPPQPEASAVKPNVLLILIDDLRPDLGSYGHSQIRSPSIDRLAAAGVRFDRAYSQFPVCNPSRVSLLTGLRPDSTGVYDNRVPFRRRLPDAVTLPQLFRESGYLTASIGKVFHAAGRRPKWRDPRSWDVQVRRSDEEREDDEPEAGRPDRSPRGSRWQAVDVEDGDLIDGWLARQAVRTLEQRGERPFFVAVGFHRPHTPYVAPRRYFELYANEPVELPPVAPSSAFAATPLQSLRSSKFEHFTTRQQREIIRAYRACVTFVDAQVGSLLDALDRLDLWKNTIVVITSDHGVHLGEQGWWTKNTVLEPSARVPMIVYAPDLGSGGRRSERLVELVDLYPTLAELAGLDPPRGLEGRSFRALLEDPDREWKQAAYTQVQLGEVMGRSVRTERWRYTEWAEGREGRELYDHRNDPGELRNLAADPDLREVVEELSRLLGRSRG